MQIKVEKTKKEIKSHGEFAFPVNVSIEHIENYEQGIFLWHWHPEIELTLILSGKMNYRINDKVFCLKQGEGVFGNSNTLHSGSQIDDIKCTYLSITFHPRFLYGYEGGVLQSKYVNYITEYAGWDALKFKKETTWQNEILQRMMEIYEQYKKHDLDFELSIHILLSQIWKNLYKYYAGLSKNEKENGKKIHRLQEILSYVQKNYQDNITLEDLSRHIGLCKNECCRFFKQYMDMTIMEYVLMLRIQNSLPLLEIGKSVTEASVLVGFSSPAYFGQIFKRYMKITPKEFQKRKRNIPESDRKRNREENETGFMRSSLLGESGAEA